MVYKDPLKHRLSRANIATVDQYYPCQGCRPTGPRCFVSSNKATLCGCWPLDPPKVGGRSYCRETVKQRYIPRANRTITTGGKYFGY